MAVLDYKQSQVPNMDYGVLSWFSLGDHEKPLERNKNNNKNMELETKHGIKQCALSSKLDAANETQLIKPL